VIFPLAKSKRLVDALTVYGSESYGITVTGFTERLCIHIKLRVTEKDGKLITLNVLICTKCADNYCSGKNLVASYILVPLIGIYHHASHVNYTCTTTIVQN